MKVLMMLPLPAPSAFRMPIICVRSNIIIRRPLIMVNPASETMSPRIIHTLTSSSSSQENTCGYTSVML